MAEAALADWLADQPVLIVLDSCEHVVGACAELAAGLLGRCPGLRILATSRESLGVRVIPSLMAGSAATGALSMTFGATSLAPHGGIWVIGLIGKPALWAAAIVAGIAVSAGNTVSVPDATRVAVGA
jgi:hypothetical protein